MVDILGGKFLIEQIFIQPCLVLVHVYESHAAYFQTLLYNSFLQEEAQAVRAISGLGEISVILMEILRADCLTEGNVLENDTNVLRVVLIIFGLNFLPGV